MDTNDVGLSFDSTPVERGVDKAEASLDRLMAVLVKLDRRMGQLQKGSATALERINATYAQLGKDSAKAFTDSASLAATALQAGNADEMQVVKRQNQALQNLYEARLITAGRISNEELLVWKNHGVSLGKIQQAQIKGWELTNLSANLAAASSVQAATKLRLLGNLGSLAADSSPLASIRKPLASDSEIILAMMAKHYAMQEKIRLSAGVLVADNSPLRSIRKSLPEDSAMILAGMNKFYADQERILSKLGVLTKDTSLLRSIRVATAEDSRIILSDMRSFYSQAEMLANTKASILARRAAGTMIPGARLTASAAAAGEALRVTGPSSADVAMLKEMGNYYRALEVAALPAAAAVGKTTDAAVRAAPAFKKLASDGNDVHSMARGLASGFGALWLTWGNLAPLFIGAAISNSFIQTAKTGMSVAHTMEIIANVGGNTKKEMVALTEELDRLGKIGPFGPLEIAEAMKTLSLAGLKANEILAVTQDVLNFSIAGTTDLKTAAETLMTVSTAFGLGASGFGKVADVISKAAADSMTSVEAFANAMKTASVINAQYGVSLEDTATGIATLAQLGIQGTAAGTALRNMYADLSGRSIKVAKILRQQGIEMRDATGAFRPMIEVVADLDTKLRTMTGISQKNFMQAILSERGAKGIVEALRLIRSEAKDTNSSVANALVEAQRNIADSAGFAAITAAKMAQTAENQFKSVKATLSSSMAEVYRDMEPSLLLIADGLKEAFASDEFKAALTFLVDGLARLSLVLVENGRLITTLAVSYGALKIAQMAAVSVLGLITASQAFFTKTVMADTAALQTNTLAQQANNATKVGAIGRFSALARAIPFVGTGLMVATTAWVAYDFWMGKSNETAEIAHDNYVNSMVKDLNDQALKLEQINQLLKEGLSLREAEVRVNAGLGKGSDRSTGFIKAAEALKAAEEAKALFVANSSSMRGGMTDLDKAQLPTLDAAIEKARRARNAASEKEANEKIDMEAAASRISRAQVEKDQRQRDEMFKRQQQVQGLFGSGTYNQGDDQESFGNNRAANALNSIFERETEQKAVLEAQASGTAELLKLEKERIQQLTELDVKYKEATKAGNGMTEAQRAELETKYKMTKALIESNQQRAMQLGWDDEELKMAEELDKAHKTELSNLAALATAREAEARARSKSLDEAERDFAFQKAMRFALPKDQKAGQVGQQIDSKYRDARESMIAASNAQVSKMTDPSLQAGEQLRLTEALKQLEIDKARELGLETAKVYQDAWDSTVNTIASNFVDQMRDGTFDLEKFLVSQFANLVLRPQLELGAQMGIDGIGKFLLGGLLGSGSVNIGTATGADMMAAFEGGGYTGPGGRSGGLDGRGGMLAMVHPDETVIDHKKGGSVGSPVSVVIYNTVGDVATKRMLDESTQSTISKVQAGMSRSMRYGGALA